MNEDNTEPLEEEVQEVEDPHLAGLLAMRDFNSEREDKGGDDTPEDTPDDTAEVVEEEPPAPQPLFTLDDGTAVTDSEEAKKGYLRHRDYTQKTQELARQRKEIEAIYNYFQSHPEELAPIVSKITKPPAPPQPQQTVKEVTLPQGYENEPAVKLLIDELNETRRQLAQVQGGVETIQQTTVQRDKRAEQESLLNTRLRDAHVWLTDKLGDNTPSPEDFIDRIKARYDAKGITPDEYMPYIIGPDESYLCTVVADIWKADIGKVVADKVVQEQQKRKPAGAKQRALKATGKTGKPVQDSVPRTKDGRLDRDKFFSQHPFIQEQLGT